MIYYALNNIHNAYHRGKGWKQAIEAYLKAPEFYEQFGPGFEHYIFSVASDFSECYTQLGEFRESLTYGKPARQTRAKPRSA